MKSSRTVRWVVNADQTADVGIDLATLVIETIGSEAKSWFTGKIPKVTIEGGKVARETNVHWP